MNQYNLYICDGSNKIYMEISLSNAKLYKEFPLTRILKKKVTVGRNLVLLYLNSQCSNTIHESEFILIPSVYSIDFSRLI